ncbi:hypothetical protein [Phenylobacterium sp.]|uniref:hypothetical protein n=1 Tax=Phenylobacterium sp. TaxID=1871053 RepID=UPI003983B6FF
MLSLTVTLRTLALAVLISAAAPVAAAGEAACRLELGVVVVPAQVAGIPGDFILDTATPQTQIHETRAQGEGFAEGPIEAEVRLAGVTLPRNSVAIADLDLRTWAFETPIAGVIGADVLKDFVVDVSFQPCRVRLSRPADAPAFRVATDLAITWISGKPSVRAQVSDGTRALEGDFAVGTGADRAVRLDEGLASVAGALKPEELYLWGNLEPRLEVLSVPGDDLLRTAAGLLKADEAGPLGLLGPGAFGLAPLRFDFPAGRLRVGPARRR